MGVERKPGSKWWYGRWMRDGKRHFVCLNVEAVGNPGEEEYETSKTAALAEFEKAVTGTAQQKRPEDLLQEIHRVKFGHRVGSISLAGLFEAWKNIPRKRQPKAHYVTWAARTFRRLLEFIQASFPRVKELAAVDKKVAEAFMRHEEGRNISPKTFNAELILLRGAFESLREDSGMLANPFVKIVTKDRETIHRKPFTPEELRAILDAVRDDDLMRPLIVVGVCTAMRRGDACLLQWEAVDLKNGYIRVKTSKTGETVEIPLFPMLQEELERRPAGVRGFVFPELARMYQENPDGVNWRLGKVFERAGFMDAKALEAMKKKRPGVEIVHLGEVHVDREAGLHTANVRGFHSFRVTWITMALAAGVPMELVCRVTGHKAADVVLKNYFKPGREDFRETIMAAMPELLTASTGPKALKAGGGYGEAAGPGDALEEALKALEVMNPRNWKKQRDVVAELVRHAKDWVDTRVVREGQEVKA